MADEVERITKDRDIDLAAMWWVRIRRGFGVPDLVSDAHAENLITKRLSKAHPIPTVELGQGERYVRSLFASFLKHCKSGDADLTVVPEDQQGLLANTWSDSISMDEFKINVFNGVRPAGMNLEIATAIFDHIVTAVKHSIDALPFETKDGHYFK
jgi:hypothetical protein